ncbi:hypothetical protein LXA43DRAFT_1091804 [Ganoderma leucocontextum]|nr:hypothetical protein LXA43DRAFT_1091804 [Ganoderma leucocontextum]
MSVDLEHGGRRVARYLGHGGEVKRIATSAEDLNLFVTAGIGGYARLFDREACKDVVLVKMWNICADERVYELATGNNAVAGLA